MSAAPYSSYSLPRHKEESARLDAQHDAYVTIIGYLLHPTIEQALPASPRIADVGTGTGIWLRDLARRSPTLDLVGFDISDAQFPDRESASGCKFEVLDITQPIPENHRGQFDVVHLSMLICGLVGDQWIATARNARQLLKPGSGFIQWQECDFLQSQVVALKPDASTKNLQRMMNEMVTQAQKVGKFSGEPQRLQTIVEDAGFRDCATDTFSSNSAEHVTELLSSVSIGAAQGTFHGIVGRGDDEFEWTVEEIDATTERARNELKDGKACLKWNIHVVTGRRAD